MVANLLVTPWLKDKIPDCCSGVGRRCMQGIAFEGARACMSRRYSVLRFAAARTDMDIFLDKCNEQNCGYSKFIRGGALSTYCTTRKEGERNQRWRVNC